MVVTKVQKKCSFFALRVMEKTHENIDINEEIISAQINDLSIMLNLHMIC